MIEIKSSKKCCKCFREENALLHLIWILLCSIESSPSLSYEESGMVELQSTWSWSLTAALQLLPARPMASLQRGRCPAAGVTAALLRYYYYCSTPPHPLQVVTLQPGWVCSSLIWTLVYIDILNIRRRLLQSSQNLHQQAVLSFKTTRQWRKIFADKCLNFRQKYNV